MRFFLLAWFGYCVRCRKFVKYPIEHWERVSSPATAHKEESDDGTR